MRIDDLTRKSVLFLGGVRDDGEFIPYGTAFFVAVPIRDGFGFIYCVTARHVLDGIRTSKLAPAMRVNMKEGDAVVAPLNTSPEHWMGHPTIEDLDIVVTGVDFSNDDFDITCCDVEKFFLKDQYIKENNVGCGDDVFVVGLLTRHFVKSRNIPIVRVGTIAAMLEEPLDLGCFGHQHAYLIESRSIGGLSGSPVFLQTPPYRIFGSEFREMVGHPVSQILGVNVGLFETLAHADRIPGEPLERREAFLETMSAGIAVVIPIQRVAEILEHAEFVGRRAKKLEEIR